MGYSKIVPSLWFVAEDGFLKVVLDYYKLIFGDSFRADKIIPLGQTPSDNAELCDVFIFGQKYSFLSTAKAHHDFNDSVSFTIQCKDQQEIDQYWDYFTSEGADYLK